MKYILTMIVASALLIGCVKTVDYKESSVDEVANKVVLENDEFRNFTRYKAPQIVGTPSDFQTYFATLFAQKNKRTNLSVYALQVQWHYVSSRWIMFDSAVLLGGRPLEFKATDRHVSSCGGATCMYQETSLVTIPIEELASTNDGLQMKFYGNGGEEVIHLSQNYIQGLLKAVALKK